MIAPSTSEAMLNRGCNRISSSCAPECLVEHCAQLLRGQAVPKWRRKVQHSASCMVHV